MTRRKITVVGAGLAGLYAAYSAALQGAEVELVEKSHIGTRHNCGEMFTEVYSSVPTECKLNGIDIFTFKTRSNGAHRRTINVDFGSSSPFVITDKCQHELIMKEKCLKEGVTIKENNAYSLSFAGRDGSYVINASGTSQYRKSMGKAAVFIIKRKGFDGFPYYYAAEFHIREDMKGYAWLFPKGREYINIGEGVCDYKSRSDNSFLKETIKEADIVSRGGGLIPMPTMSDYIYNMQEISNNVLNILNVGNAAGLVNPYLGGGEHLAVISGMLAGEMCAHKNERRFVTALDDIIGDEMRFGISIYEMMLKQDVESLERILELKVDEKIKDIMFSNSTRKALKKWISMPEITNKEMEGFISS